ncbi:MAG: hypothetical protein L3J31_08205, partial [Bacteroidales bacterium]|nr:hypothetical protein [Bacteroidales bacterium]
MSIKRILVISYSQSGQLDEIVANITRPLSGKVAVVHEKLVPVPDFPFPWKDISFWDAMPESVQMIPSQLKPLSIDPNVHFDLLILAYPIWFLSPPIPLTTFLKSETAKEILNGKPVLTVIGSRNMWVNAQEDIKKMIAENGGQLKGNISLRDRHNNLLSVVTIIYWMISGKKERYLGIFPKPGISDKDIAAAERFGQPISDAIAAGSFENLHKELLKLKSVELDPAIISIEQKGKRLFKIWSRFILRKGGAGSAKREARLKLFKWYLLFVIFAVSPIATILFYLTYPLFFW